MMMTSRVLQTWSWKDALIPLYILLAFYSLLILNVPHVFPRFIHQNQRKKHYHFRYGHCRSVTTVMCHHTLKLDLAKKALQMEIRVARLWLLRPPGPTLQLKIIWEILWWSNDYDSVLSLQGAQVQCLVRDLRFHKPWNMAPQNLLRFSKEKICVNWKRHHINEWEGWINIVEVKLFCRLVSIKTISVKIPTEIFTKLRLF